MADTSEVGVRTSYLDWSPILGGAVAAAAISFVLFTAGAAIGLSLLSPYPTRSYGSWAASLAAFWAIFVPILSLLVGGYIAGRMRAAWGGNAEEVEFRDGVHGLLVWATAVIIGALIAQAAAGAATGAGAELGKAAIADRGTLLATSVDALLRPGPGAAQQSPPATSATNDREELGRILVTATANGSLDTADRDYLVQAVARRTGLAPEEAQKRVNEVYAKALDTVDTARKAAVAAGLATATALLLGLAAAWYAAQRGGHHRDQNIPARFNILVMRRRA
jgi:hypothetical protein